METERVQVDDVHGIVNKYIVFTSFLYQYTLPDGSSLDIGPARFRAPEVLFR